MGRSEKEVSRVDTHTTVLLLRRSIGSRADLELSGGGGLLRTHLGSL